jgi:hypothetical protein
MLVEASILIPAASLFGQQWPPSSAVPVVVIWSVLLLQRGSSPQSLSNA